MSAFVGLTEKIHGKSQCEQLTIVTGASWV